MKHTYVNILLYIGLCKILSLLPASRKNFVFIVSIWHFYRRIKRIRRRIVTASIIIVWFTIQYDISFHPKPFALCRNIFWAFFETNLSHKSTNTKYSNTCIMRNHVSSIGREDFYITFFFFWVFIYADSSFNAWIIKTNTLILFQWVFHKHYS